MDREQQDELHRRIEQLERRYCAWRLRGIAAMAVAAVLIAYGAMAHAHQQPESDPLIRPPKIEPAQVKVDSTGLQKSYTNYFRITGNPDEVILDFGFYSQVKTETGPEPVKLTDRMVMNFYTAKKLKMVLDTVVTRHEEAFGQIELDPNKRLKPMRKRD